MTPADLLASVKRQFPVLVHGTGPEGETALEDQLREAIREYQDRRGFKASLVIADDLANIDGLPLPEDWITVLNSHDAKNVHVITDVYDYLPDGATADQLPEKHIKCLATDYHCPPYRIHYLQDLSLGDLGDDILNIESVGIIRRYLYALIEIPNTSRLRAMYEGIDHPAREQLPSPDTLEQNKASIREEMSLEAGDLLPVMAL